LSGERLRQYDLAPSPSLTDDEVLRHTGQTAVRDVATAGRLVAQAEDAFRVASERLRQYDLAPLPTFADDELLRYTGQTVVCDVPTAGRLVVQAEEAFRLSCERLRQHDRLPSSSLLRYWQTALTTGSDLADSVAAGLLLALVPFVLLRVILRLSVTPAVALSLVVVSLFCALTYRVVRTLTDSVAGLVLALLPAILLELTLRLSTTAAVALSFVLVSLFCVLTYGALRTTPDERSRDRAALRKEKYRSWRRQREALARLKSQWREVLDQDRRLLQQLRLAGREPFATDKSKCDDDLRQKRHLLEQLRSGGREPFATDRNKCDDDLRQKQHLLEQLRRAIQDAKVKERHKLLAIDLPALSGPEFEQFLERVFKALGYEVTLTKGSYDQGVDLIIKNGKEQVAIQAKGYQGAVGNEAVQQAVSGRLYSRICQMMSIV
jgi:hypothetical protein